jgi:hypothetical protein
LFVVAVVEEETPDNHSEVVLMKAMHTSAIGNLQEAVEVAIHRFHVVTAGDTEKSVEADMKAAVEVDTAVMVAVAVVDN